MMPTVTQVLSALRQTMEQTVAPALPEDGAFVQEQAALIMASLDWLVDVHESEYGYELAENEDYRAFFAQLDHDVDPAPPAGDLAALREQNRAFKASAAARVAHDERARDLLLDVAERQAAREQAWFRMTGLAGEAPAGIADLLAANR